MARITSFIKDITPNTPRPWTVKVRVLEKSTPRDARASPTKFQKLVLADSVGGRVQLTLFNAHIGMFKDRLEVYRYYYISNAIVKEAALGYQFGSTNYQWYLHSTCLVEDANYDEENPQPHPHDFVRIDELVKLKDSTSTIDVLCIALQMLPRKTVNTKTGTTSLQEVIVIDQSMKPMVMTFWDQFIANDAANLSSVIDQKPVLAAIRVKVLAYSGLTLNSRSSSSFLINPTIPDAVNLRSWLYDNMQAINDLLNSEDFISTARSFGKEVVDQLTTVAAASSQHHLRMFNVKCQLRLTNYDQQFVFMSCGDCNGKTSALYNTAFTCNFCRKSGMISTPRLRAEINVSDSTGAVLATFTGSDAEVFLGCSVETLYRNSLLAKPKPVQSFIKTESHGDSYVQLRAYSSIYLGVTTRKFVAFFISHPDGNIVEGDGSGEGSSALQTTLDIEHAMIGPNDPELTPEERQMMENVLKRKKCKLQPAAPVPVKPLSIVELPASNKTALLEGISSGTHPDDESHYEETIISLDGQDNSEGAMKVSNQLDEASELDEADDEIALPKAKRLSVGKTTSKKNNGGLNDDDGCDWLLKDAMPPKARRRLKLLSDED